MTTEKKETAFERRMRAFHEVQAQLAADRELAKQSTGQTEHQEG